MENLNELLSALGDEELSSIDYEDIDNSNILFRTTNYQNKFFEAFSQFYINGNFCDIVLRIRNDTQSIRAHKIILSSVSPYFRAMFTGGFKDQELNEIFLENISFRSLDSIINFIYNSVVIINENDVQNLLLGSKMLQIEDVEKACCKYLALKMDSSNCIGMNEFAESCGCITLSKMAQKYMETHFTEVTNNEEFLNLSQEQLCKYLSRDEITVECESIVFNSIVNWVKYDPENRRSNLDHLFQCVRFPFLSPYFLKEQMQNEFFKHKEPDNALQTLRKACDELIMHKPCQVNPRNPCVNHSCFVIGGYHRQSLNLVERLKISTKTWIECEPLSEPRSGLACVAISRFIYVLGGRNNSMGANKDCADVECYDTSLNIWKKCSPMKIPRSRAGAAVIDGFIYIVGGAQACKHHSSVERYDPQNDTWEFVAPMAVARNALGCAQLCRLLYAIGGYDGTNRLDIVECYNPDTNSWNFVAKMNMSRSGAGVISIENYVYAIGGYTVNEQLNSAERYDPLTNQWTFIKPMTTPRSALACVSCRNRIVAIGGYDGENFLDSIEIYNTAEDVWTTIGTINSKRSGHTAAIVYDQEEA